MANMRHQTWRPLWQVHTLGLPASRLVGYIRIRAVHTIHVVESVGAAEPNLAFLQPDSEAATPQGDLRANSLITVSINLALRGTTAKRAARAGGRRGPGWREPLH